MGRPLLLCGAVLGLGLLAPMGLALVVVSAVAAPGPAECAAAAPVVAPNGTDAPSTDLDQTQAAHVATIISTGRTRGVPEEGIVIALATASQESGFRVYANDGRGDDLAADQVGISRSLTLPHDAVGTDHGSLGLFQQQWPWWGPMETLMDPSRSATLFYDALLATPGWSAMAPGQAAQSVQRSAFPSAYDDDVALARALLAAAGGAPKADGCGSDGQTSPDGDVVMPVATGPHVADLHNWGGSGAHWSSWHTGTDFAAPCGTPVRAAHAGTVSISTSEAWAGRWLVRVSEGPGQLTTWYAHMQSLTVSAGQAVAPGQVIGAVGAEGNATGCHLHFEVHTRGGSIYGDDNVNPSAWLATRVGQSVENWSDRRAA